MEKDEKQCFLNMCMVSSIQAFFPKNLLKDHFERFHLVKTSLS